MQTDKAQLNKTKGVMLSIPRCPVELKEAIFEYAARKGRSGASQATIFLWDRIEELGIEIKGGGGNRTRSGVSRRMA